MGYFSIHVGLLLCKSCSGGVFMVDFSQLSSGPLNISTPNSIVLGVYNESFGKHGIDVP